ncbi:MAG: polysaccharide deacetylase family protein [Proteobacteria bacterium]|nr:MAG: polysaccharide deacetylase family protein [Pseudomonadota bacterium]
MEGADAAIARLADTGALVLLYHAAFERPPQSMEHGLHNVRPGVIRAQVERLARRFRFVDVDFLANAPDPRGLAAVTFDDGYRCVFDNALPVLEDLGVPVTVYLNGSRFEGEAFWRDKVRFVENRGWVPEFEAFAGGEIRRQEGRRFYRYSKSPRVNSRRIDELLDRFLEHRGVSRDLPRLCVDDIDDLPGGDLVSYGNHGHRHYVLSSLTPEEQENEIARTQALLDRIAPRRTSRLFSVPFGAADDINAATAAALRARGYEVVLMSRNRAHGPPAEVHGIGAVERFMPRDDEFVFGLEALLDVRGVISLKKNSPIG